MSTLSLPGWLQCDAAPQHRKLDTAQPSHARLKLAKETQNAAIIAPTSYTMSTRSAPLTLRQSAPRPYYLPVWALYLPMTTAQPMTRSDRQQSASRFQKKQ
ncbi:unnamed protein product [Cercospora beticola]|nr:unnamed protein product [Cercospora beticola]